MRRGQKRRFGVPRHTGCVERLETEDAKLADADVQRFLARARSNPNLKLSRWNLARNAVGRGGVAGAAGGGLANWLEDANCRVMDLDVSWNMLRGSAAGELGAALAKNIALTRLNVAFNSLAEAGVDWGRALLENNTLKHLNLSRNALGPRAAFALSVALLRIQSALDHLVLDGNPLGFEGGKALLRVLTRVDHRATLSLNDCSFPGADAAEAVVENEVRDVSLDLGDAYDHCVALDIIQGDASRPCPPISSCVLQKSGEEPAELRTALKWATNPARF